MFIPCALAAAALLLVLCMMGASATSAGRRSLEVARAGRWVRLAAASAFDEAVARVEVLTAQRQLPMPASPDDARDFSLQLGWLVATPLPTTTTGQTFKDESVVVGPVAFRTGPWVIQSSGGARPMVRELGLVELSVQVTVQRAGQRVRKLVTVQRYATAVPAPEGFRVTVSPTDVFHLEANV